MSTARMRAASAKHASNITKRGDESISNKAKRSKAEEGAGGAPQWMIAAVVAVVIGGVVMTLFR